MSQLIDMLHQAAQHLRLSLAKATFARRVVEHTYCGEKLKVNIEDPLGKAWYDGDWPQLHEIDLLVNSRLKSGALVYDLGSHQGIVAMILARKAGADGKVICAEPSPHNYRCLVANAQLNGIDNIVAVQAAISDTTGTLKFNSSLNGKASSILNYGMSIDVEQTTINLLVEKYGNPDVVILDIEGFELKALSSATSLFTKPCDFMVEVHVGAGLEAVGGSAAAVLEYFPGESFERYVHHDDGKKPIRIEDAPDDFFSKRFFLTALSRKPVNQDN